MRVTDESAEELRAWLNMNHRLHQKWPITDEQLAYWLTDAESDGSGVVELGSLYSITGAPMTFRVRFEEAE